MKNWFEKTLQVIHAAKKDRWAFKSVFFNAGRRSASVYKRSLSQEPIKEWVELAIFFFFLATSLFLGDGKQPFVDVWWALGILMMYGVRYYQRGRLDLRPLPRPIGLVWSVLILYYVILTPFSDSAGYSITATIRLIEAYLAYLLFYTISSEKTINLFVKGLLFAGVVATLASFVFLLFPTLASFLPPMNLLYATYGHNHLADLLLPIFPLLIAQFQHKQSKLLWFLLILFTVGILLTFARGAWILLVFYLLFLVWRSKNKTVRRVGLFVATIIVATFLLVQKPSLLADGRWEYWRQSIEAIKERPIFGSGPGTFYLQSKRLQAAPSSYSWFTHSFPLETMVEVGLVGLLLLFVLLYLVFRRVSTSPLFWGAVLVFMYSFYEFALDFAAMWLLVWAALGALIKHNVQKPAHSKIVIGALAVLALFYVLNIGSLGASVLGNKMFAFFLAPHDTNTTEEFLEEQKGNQADIKDTAVAIITFFHKKNPETVNATADWIILTQQRSKAPELYEKALSFDPRNHQAYVSLGRVYKGQNSVEAEIETYKRLFRLSDTSGETVRQVQERLQEMGQDLYEKQEYTLSFKAYDLLLDLNPFSNEVFLKEYPVLRLSEKLIQQGKRVEATRLLESYLLLWRDSKIKHYFVQSRAAEKVWGLYAQLLGEEDNAGDYTKAIEFFPPTQFDDIKDERAYRNLSALLVQSGNIVKAEALWRACVRNLTPAWCAVLFTHKDISATWEKEARVKQGAGDNSKQIKSLRLALFADPWRGDLYITLERMFMSAKQTDAARELEKTCLIVFSGQLWCRDIYTNHK